jgi:hypothetical protein
MPPYRLTLVMLACIGLAGCVFSVSPLTKPTPPTAAVAPAAQEPEEAHHSTHYYRCKAGFKPLSDDDRPKLGNVDTADKAKLNIALAAYIRQLDQYITARQHKEETAYRAWRNECDDFLN